ncbi:MAG: hypothetical protein VSS75_020955 [Candidatus Parabeggiatoa sp.]|nr:hypothetical protein [Candidatus Parabeggiatoa sp.]
MGSKSYAKLSLVVLLSTLSLGLSSVAKADMKWVETIKQYCPTLCQKTDYKFAVPGGINPRATQARGSESVYYVCATLYSGWRIGYNIDYQHDRCYTGFRSSEHYGEHYFCLCSNQQIPLITNDMVKR